MKKKTALLFLLGMSLVVAGSVRAGDLDPPGPPASTMVTLEEISDRLAALETEGAAVAKTGQSGCWSEGGAPIACAGTGQDGEYQAGVSVGPRFADNGDGTVTDNLTGLIWLKDANCFGQRNWGPALEDANNLADGACELTDGSAAGDWRLPNLRELHSLVDYQILGVPPLPSGHPFSGVQTTYYWTSTTFLSWPPNAWVVYFFSSDGSITALWKMDVCYVWPVRGGL